MIRSLAVGKNLIAAQAGGAILAESDPNEEYEEMLVKIAPLLAGAEAPSLQQRQDFLAQEIDFQS